MDDFDDLESYQLPNVRTMVKWTRRIGWTLIGAAVVATVYTAAINIYEPTRSGSAWSVGLTATTAWLWARWGVMRAKMARDARCEEAIERGEVLEGPKRCG